MALDFDRILAIPFDFERARGSASTGAPRICTVPEFQIHPREHNTAEVIACSFIINYQLSPSLIRAKTKPLTELTTKLRPNVAELVANQETGGGFVLE